MSKRDQDIAYFLSFCIEQYKTEKRISGAESAKILGRYGVLDYLADHYEVLHTQSRQWLMEDIDEFISLRKENPVWKYITVAWRQFYAAFALYEGGLIDKQTLIAELKTYKLVDQYLFHTEQSLRLLKFLETKEVSLWWTFLLSQMSMVMLVWTLSWQEKVHEMNLEITQDNLYLLLPSKISLMTEMLCEDTGISVVDAMKRIYASPTYRQLEQEETKMWHLGPVALYEMAES